MNHVYRILWNEATGCFTAVAETACGRGKRSLGKKARAALAAAVVAHATGAAWAGPAGGQVSAGQGTISAGGATTTIHQTSPRLAINWQSFNVGAGEAVNFVQPGANAVALNRVLGTEGSAILGRLNANGQVFILNPNGVLFGAGAQVNVGGLLASTLSLSDADFMAGRHTLKGDGRGAGVINRGTITAADGGYVALVGAQAANTGTIAARMGSVALAAGEQVTLDFAGDGLLRLAVDQGAVSALASNGGLLQADGGHVLMTARAADALAGTVVNNTGVVQARTLENHAGTIRLLGGFNGGTVAVDGTLDASAPQGGDGGFIDTSGAQVKVAPATRVSTLAVAGRGKTGTWLIDPADYNISATGGDISGATLTANLATSNVSILSSSGATTAGKGDININDAFSWSANELTLTAARDINVNAVVTATGSAALVMNTATANGADAAVAEGRVNVALGASGFTGRVDMATGTTLHINGEPYTIVNSLGTEGVIEAPGQLQGMYYNANARFVLGSDIDASATSTWATGFSGMPNYQGRFNGLGHTISNLTINAPTADEVGLFGRLASNGNARIANVGLTGGSITGRNNVGALVGIAFGSSNAIVSNSYSTAAVQGSTNVGGLVGSLSQGRIVNSHAGGAVTGNATSYQYIGGLVGTASAFAADVALATDSYASGAVTAGGQHARVGGLIGHAGLGTVLRSHATGQVHGAPANTAVGGLIGYVSATRIEASHASGDVRGSDTSSFNGGLGGLVGYLERGTVTGSHASGAVAPTGAGTTGHSYIGGLVGVAGVTGTTTITDSYSTGAVSGPIFNGGLVGGMTGGIVNLSGSYSSGTVTALATNGGSGGLVGVTSPTGATVISDSYASGTVSGNPFYAGGLVAMAEGNTTVSNSHASGTITGGTTRGGLVGYSAGTVTLSNNFWNSTGGAAAGNATTGQNLGATPLTAAQFKDRATFSQAGWNISDAGGSNAVWRIYPGHTAPLLRRLLTPFTLADAADTSLVYNASTQSGGTTALTAPGLLGSAASGRDVGTYHGYYSTQLNGLDITGGALTITPAPLAVTGITASGRVYDTSTAVALGGTPVVTPLGSDSVQVGGTGVGTFADKHVGNNKPVTVTGYMISGTDAANYTVVQPAGLTASVTPAALAVTGITANGRVYDATRVATLAGTAAVAGLPGDAVGVTGTGTGSFADKNVGNDKPVTVTGYTLTGADAGNYSVVQPQGLTASITPASLAVNATAVSRAYDTGTAVTVNASVAPLGTDAVSVTGGAGSVADKHVGTARPVSVTPFALTGADAGNYAVVQPTGLTADITPAQLAVTGITANTRVYDTTAVATLSGTAAVAGLNGDDVGLTGTGVGAFADKHVGNNKPVTVTGYSLTGADAGNYAIVQPAGLTADITPAPLAVTGVAAGSRVYDTTRAAALSGTAAVAPLPGDVVGVAGTPAATFATRDVGTAKPVTVTGFSLSGPDAGNYTVVQPAGLTADITPAPLAVSGISAVSRVYDATTAVALAGTAAVAALGSDSVSVAGTGAGSFADRHVGTAKPVTVTGYSLTGADAANYSIVQPAGLTANVTPAPLAVTGITANDKVYDTTTAATLAGTAAVAGLGSDSVGVTGTGIGSFANKNVGTAKPVTVSGYSLTGADAGNYSIVQPAGVVASITPASVTVTGVAAISRVYDTTAAATLSGSATVVALAGDSLGVTGTGVGAFADKHVGHAKPVSVTGYSLTGADAGNYAIVQPAGLTADITPAPLAVSGISAVSRVYDATTAVALAGTAAVAALGSDSVSVAGTGAGSFADRHVGTAKPVTVTGYSLTGADAANYSIVQPTGLTANVTPAPLAVTGITASDKVYDTTTAATLAGTAAVAGLGSDSVGVAGTGTGSFANKTVGTAKPVTVSGYSLTGADAGNYSIVQPAGVVASITPASLVVSGVSAVNKVYDTTTAATLAGTAVVSPLPGDGVSVTGSGMGAFADRHAGDAKPVTVTGYSLVGTDAANYTIVQPAGLTARITPANLAVTGVTALDKVYDGGVVAVLGGTAAVTPLGADNVTVVAGSGAFADKNVGNARPVTVTGFSLSGADAGNYAVVQPAGITASITPAPLAVTADDKVKEIGTPDPAFTFSTGPLAGGDTLADALTGALGRAAGEGLGTYAINQGTLAAVAGNYAIAFTPGELRVQETPPPAPPPPRPPVTPPPVSGPAPGPAPVQPVPEVPPAPPPVGQGPDVPAAPAPLPQGPALVALLRAADSAAATAGAVSSEPTQTQGSENRRGGQDNPGAGLADLPISVTGAGMQMP